MAERTREDIIGGMRAALEFDTETGVQIMEHLIDDLVELGKEGKGEGGESDATEA